MNPERFNQSTYSKYQASLSELPVSDCVKEALGTRLGYKSFMAITKQVDIKMSGPSAGNCGMESQSSVTRFSQAASTRIIEVCDPHQTREPSIVCENIKRWSERELTYLYPNQLPSKTEQSCARIFSGVIKDTEVVYNYFVEQGAPASIETLQLVLHFTLKSRKRVNIGTLSDIAAILKATDLWNFDDADWIDIIRPEHMGAPFERRIAAIREQRILKEEYLRRKDSKDLTLLDVLHITGKQHSTSYRELFERLTGINKADQRDTLNDYADSLGISAAVFAMRYAAIRQILLEKRPAQDLLTIFDTVPVEIERYNTLLKARESFHTLLTVRDTEKLEEQGVILAVKLYEEMLFNLVIGRNNSYTDAAFVEQYTLWILSVIERIYPLSESIINRFPFTSQGIQWHTLQKVFLKGAELSQSEFVLQQRTGAQIGDRLRAIELLTQLESFNEAVSKLQVLWQRDYRQLDRAELLNETPTAVSSAQVALLIEALLNGNNDCTGLAHDFLCSEDELKRCVVVDRTDPDYFNKVKEAVQVYSRIVKPRSGSARWYGLVRQKNHALDIAADEISNNNNYYFLRFLLYTQVQGYSVREVVRSLDVPPHIATTLSSNITEILRIINGREISKTGRG